MKSQELDTSAKNISPIIPDQPYPSSIIHSPLSIINYQLRSLAFIYIMIYCTKLATAASAATT